MKRKNCLSLTALLFALCSAPAYAIESITIIADSSMSLAVSALARSYARENQIVVNTSFASKEAQETEITEGAAADILLTPKESWIEDLKQRGLVDINSRTLIARGRLALVGPEETNISMEESQAFPTTTLIQKMGWEPGFVIGYPEARMEGVYSLEALRKLGAYDIEPYLLYVKQFEQMVEMVSKNDSFGMFLYSTVLGRKNMKVLALMPESSHKPIAYYGVVIAGENMEQARRFLEFLQSPKAIALLNQYGFSV
jgi:molybdate transport system substrate-binding protein